MRFPFDPPPAATAPVASEVAVGAGALGAVDPELAPLVGAELADEDGAELEDGGAELEFEVAAPLDEPHAATSIAPIAPVAINPTAFALPGRRLITVSGSAGLRTEWNMTNLLVVAGIEARAIARRTQDETREPRAMKKELPNAINVADN